MSGAPSQSIGGQRQPFELGAGAYGLFTSRAGGVSAAPYDTLNMSRAVGDESDAVRRNRELVAAGCGLTTAGMAWMHQVHGSGVVRLRDGDLPQDPLPRTDAIFTDAPGTALCVMVADCAPVLVADPVAAIAGAAHAGREGMAAGVVPALVAAMSAAGADPARMRVMIGPSICGRCYEVPWPLHDRVAAAVPESSCRTSGGLPGIDIRAGIEAQLAGCGVRSVRADRRCTAETPELFSYRRDGSTGRFTGLIWLAP